MPDRKKPKLEIKNFNVKKTLDNSAMIQDHSPSQLYPSGKTPKNPRNAGINMNVFY